MKGQTENTIFSIIGIVVVIIFILAVARGFFISPRMSNEKICRLEYGEDWAYDFDFHFKDTCIELDYITLNIINRTKLITTSKEAVDKFCVIPGFWELSNWEAECLNG